MLKELPEFAADYHAELIEFIANGEADYAFRTGITGSRSLMVSVQPNTGTSWTGRFVGEDAFRGGMSGLFGTPSSQHLCVVERGSAFLVNVQNPLKSSVISSDGPVRHVYPLVAFDALLLVTSWTVTALGHGTVHWRTRRLAIEGIRLDDVVDNHLVGIADPDDDEAREFEIDLRTGIATLDPEYNADSTR